MCAFHKRRTSEKPNVQCARGFRLTRNCCRAPRLFTNCFCSLFHTFFFVALDPAAGEPTAGQRANNYIEELSLGPGVERTLRVRYCAASPAPASAGAVGPDDDDDDDAALTAKANVGGGGGGGSKASARSSSGKYDDAWFRRFLREGVFVFLSSLCVLVDARLPSIRCMWAHHLGMVAPADG